MPQEHNELLQEAGVLVAAFEERDRTVSSEMMAGNADAFTQTLEAKQRVKEFLAKHPAFRATGILAKKLKNIRDNRSYHIDSVFAVLNEHGPNGPYVQEALGVGDRNFIDALFEEGTASYVDEGFFRRRAEVGALIVSQGLPDYLLKHADRIRECYSLGLSAATVVFCRSLIEAALFEALRRRGQVTIGQNIADYGEYSLQDLMRRIRPFLPTSTHKAAVDVIKRANLVLHSKNDTPTAVKPLEAIRDTFTVVEALFT